MTNLLKTTAILVCCLCIPFAGKAQQNGTQDRAFWVETLTRIADPVLTNLSNNTLKKNMPYESLSKDRSDFSHLEVVWYAVLPLGWNWGRTIRPKDNCVINISN